MSEADYVRKFDTFDSLHDEFSKKLSDLPGHSAATYEAIHSYLVEELSVIGEACDDGLSDGDFIMDRTVGDSVPIGIVVEDLIAGTIAAVQKALSRIGVDYSAHLDLDEAQIVITKGGIIAVHVEDGDADAIIRAIR